MPSCTPDSLMELLLIIWNYMLSFENDPRMFWPLFLFFVWHLLKSVVRRISRAAAPPVSGPQDESD